MYEKLKSLVGDDRFFMAFLVILVAVASFGLGRHSVSDIGLFGGGGAGVVATVAYTGGGEEGEMVATSTATVERAPKVETIPTKEPAAGAGPYVASRSGTKYHHESCGGAKQIKPENKLYFTTEAAAKAAGYSPAANCAVLTNP